MSSELLRDLANASASIARFQEITAPRVLAPASDDNSSHHRQPPTPSYYSQSLAGSTGLRPLSPPYQSSTSQPVSLPSLRAHALHEPPARLAPPARVLFPIRGQPIDRTTTPSPASPQSSTRSSPSLESSCCGGYIDCTDLVEEEGEGNQDSGGNFSLRTSRNLAN